MNERMNGRMNGTTGTNGTAGTTGTNETAGTYGTTATGTGPGDRGGPGSPVVPNPRQPSPRQPIPKIVLPHGGYKKLIVYRKSDVIYQGTVTFCRRFLPAHGDRTVDQMTQAARSCKQNIAEGSAASGTSKETEIKLTNVARATLDELLEDYLDWLKSHNQSEWPSDDPKRIAARDFAKAHADWADWQPLFETRPPETLANLMVTLCHQTRYLLDKMIAAQEEDFKRHGGVRERMHAARTAARGEEWDKTIYSRLDSAVDAADLDARLAEIKRKADQAAWSIRRRKGWK